MVEKWGWGQEQENIIPQKHNGNKEKVGNWKDRKECWDKEEVGKEC